MAFTRPRFQWEREPERRLTFNWGDLVFEAQGNALQVIRLGTSHNWARQPRLGTLESVQYVGTSLASLSMAGVILLGGFKSFDELRAAGGSTTPYALTDGTGRPWGRYALTRIQLDVGQMLPTGELRQAGWSMDFVEVRGGSEGVFTVDESRLNPGEVAT